MTRSRRQVGLTAAAVLVGTAGCLTGEPGTGFDENDTADASANTTDNELSPSTKQLVDDLTQRGLTVRAATATDDAIRLTVQTTGNTDEDIELAASGFATLLNSDAAIDRDLRVRVEDRGLDQGRFRIEAAWARQFLSDEISDSEYLTLIADTYRA